MITMDCDRTPNYRDWLNPPAIYDRCQPTYEDTPTFSQAEVDEWLLQVEDTWGTTENPSVAPAVAAPVKQLVDIRTMFKREAERWSSETGHLSSPTQKMLHPSYQAILGMGQEHREETIDLLLQDLKENRRPWFWALSYLAQTNPITPAEAGRMDQMIDAWVRWGKSRNNA